MDELKSNFTIQTPKKPPGGRRPGAGRPKGKVSAAKKAIAEMARDHAEDALQVLVDVARDKEAPAAARVSAANAIIDRGYGKTPAKMDVTVNPIAEAIREISERGSAMLIWSEAPSRPTTITAAQEDEDIDP